MTQTLRRLDKPKIVTAYEDDPFFEDAVPCVIRFRAYPGGPLDNCPNIATFDAIVTCELNHERTQHYCDNCHARAQNGGVDCRVCRDGGMAPESCPVTLLVSFPRSVL